MVYYFIKMFGKYANAYYLYFIKQTVKTMKTTMTFTTEHEAELRRIATLNVFASKIAQTILSNEIYRASAKQVDILNEVSEITFYISSDYSFRYEEDAQRRMRENLPSSMRRF